MCLSAWSPWHGRTWLSLSWLFFQYAVFLICTLSVVAIHHLHLHRHHQSYYYYIQVGNHIFGVTSAVNQRRQWQPHPILLPGKSHGRRSLVGYSPWGHEELKITERLHFHFLLSCIGEGNGNPLQCSCLENPRDGGAWWAAIYGVAQHRTRPKRLSSSRRHSQQCTLLS